MAGVKPSFRNTGVAINIPFPSFLLVLGVVIRVMEGGKEGRKKGRKEGEKVITWTIYKLDKYMGAKSWHSKVIHNIRERERAAGSSHTIKD